MINMQDLPMMNIKLIGLNKAALKVCPFPLDPMFCIDCRPTLLAANLKMRITKANIAAEALYAQLCHMKKLLNGMP